MSSPLARGEPDADCPLCERLAEFRHQQRQQHPDWHNAPVPAFGDPAARLAIIGLAPGLRGANRTGRPFTGDHAGGLLYGTLKSFGFACGTYGAEAGDGLRLNDCIVINAVRCVPPQNRPTPKEVRTCNGFLGDSLRQLPNLRVLLALGRIAHDATALSFGLRPSKLAFAHGATHHLADELVLVDSYHCSRQNTNTGRLTPAMFEAVFVSIRERLDQT